MIQYSQGDVEVSTLLLRSSEGDGESGFDPLRLVDKLDPELVMIDCREGNRDKRRDEDRKAIQLNIFVFIHISV